MAELATLVASTRELLRDFPTFFEVEQGPIRTLTIRLPHALTAPSPLQVFLTDLADPDNPVTTETDEYELDQRNGLIKLTNADFVGQRFLCAGYHYTWFTDSDISRHVHDVYAEFESSKNGDNFSDVELEVLAMGAVVHALWSLSIELALDIDVSSPEGINIPAHQRYAQVVQMMQHWEQKFEEKSAMLNLGLKNIEQFHLRRVSRLTNRYVPEYRSQELGDWTWPERLFPPIPDRMQGSTPEYDAIEVTEAYRPGGRLWSGIYPSGSYPEGLGTGSWQP